MFVVVAHNAAWAGLAFFVACSMGFFICDLFLGAPDLFGVDQLGQ